MAVDKIGNTRFLRENPAGPPSRTPPPKKIFFLVKHPKMLQKKFFTPKNLRDFARVGAQNRCGILRGPIGDHSRTIPPKFGSNSFSGFRGVD